MIPRGVDKGLQLGEELTRLGGQLFPREGQPRHRHVAQAHDDGEERVQILEVPTAAKGSVSLSVPRDHRRAYAPPERLTTEPA